MGVLVSHFQAIFYCPYAHLKLSTELKCMVVLATKGICNFDALRFATCSEHGFQNSIEVITNRLRAVRQRKF